MKFPIYKQMKFVYIFPVLQVRTVKYCANLSLYVQLSDLIIVMRDFIVIGRQSLWGWSQTKYGWVILTFSFDLNVLKGTFSPPSENIFKICNA